jgi:hypothetical protein
MRLFVATARGDVVSVAASVTVWDQPIHQVGHGHARQESQGHQDQAAQVQAGGTAYAIQGLVQQAQGRGGQHEPSAQTKDAVVGPSRELPNEEEGKSADAGHKAGQGSGGECLQH